MSPAPIDRYLAPARANVLLIHCHDLGRFLRCYGNLTGRTLNLNRLADEGVRFTNALCTAPQCSPSRASLFTGGFPHANGVMGLTHASFGWDLHPTERHLDSLLGEAGYCSDMIGVHHESKRLPDHDIAALLGFDTPGPRWPNCRVLSITWMLRSAGFSTLSTTWGYGTPRSSCSPPTTGWPCPVLKCTLYDPGLETALIVRAPGRGWSDGRVVDGLVSNVDLVPTLLEAASAEVPSHLHGDSLIASLKGESPAGRQEIFGEITFHTYDDPRRCIRKSIVVGLVGLGELRRRSRPPRLGCTVHVGRGDGKVDQCCRRSCLRRDPRRHAEQTRYVDAGTGVRIPYIETDDPLLAGPVVAPTHLEATEFLA